MTMQRIGLDTSRASPELRAAIERGASTLCIIGRQSGVRLIRYRYLVGENLSIAEAEAKISATLPLGRLVAGQVYLEDRDELDMLRQATGLVRWLVAQGDLTEQWTPGGGPGGTPIAASA